jgi:hypothetical protein
MRALALLLATQVSCFGFGSNVAIEVPSDGVDTSDMEVGAMALSAGDGSVEVFVVLGNHNLHAADVDSHERYVIGEDEALLMSEHSLRAVRDPDLRYTAEVPAEDLGTVEYWRDGEMAATLRFPESEPFELSVPSEMTSGTELTFTWEPATKQGVQFGGECLQGTRVQEEPGIAVLAIELEAGCTSASLDIRVGSERAGSAEGFKDQGGWPILYEYRDARVSVRP